MPAIFPLVNKSELIAYLERIDTALQHPAMLYIYGSAACILLDEPDRTSLDIDVAAPYSDVIYKDIEQAAEAAGLPINPDESMGVNHVEWIQSLRLCLPKPAADTGLVLWHGSKLTIRSAPVAELIASKLIRYDEIDQSDIQYLASQAPPRFADIEDAVRRLPPPFNTDVLVLDNLENLRNDLETWKGEPA